MQCICSGPSGRTSSRLSTCRLSHCFLPAGWTASESSGREPTAPFSPEPANVSGIYNSTRVFHRESIPLWQSTQSLQCLFLFRVPAVSDYSQSPDSGNKTCCFMASEVFMKGADTCPCVYMCSINNMHLFKWSVFLSARSGLGQLGDPSVEPNHRSVCPLQLCCEHWAVSIIPLRRPELAGILYILILTGEKNAV